MSAADKIRLDGLTSVTLDSHSAAPASLSGVPFPYAVYTNENGSIISIHTADFDSLPFEKGTVVNCGSITFSQLTMYDQPGIAGAPLSALESDDMDRCIASIKALTTYIIPAVCDELYAAANHSHDGYAAADHTHADYLTSDSALNGSKITSGTVPAARLPSATSSAAGILSYTNFRHLLSSITATAITALSTSYRQVIASISASASFKFTGSTAFSAGREIHVLIKNTGSDEITVTLPGSGIYDNGGTDTLTIPAGGYAEVNAISDGSKIYLRAVA